MNYNWLKNTNFNRRPSCSIKTFSFRKILHINSKEHYWLNRFSANTLVPYRVKRRKIYLTPFSTLTASNYYHLLGRAVKTPQK